MSEHNDPTPELTLALRQLADGDGGVERSILEVLLRELRSIAVGYARSQRDGHTLQPTALVNEAVLKLFGNAGLEDVQDRKHFYRIAARAMRQILVDHARRQSAAKRGGSDGLRVTLHDDLVGGLEVDDELLDLDQALTELGELDARQARLVELRFFVGLEVDEVAAIMEVSRSTVEREWRAARAWLGRRIAAGKAT